MKIINKLCGSQKEFLYLNFAFSAYAAFVLRQIKDATDKHQHILHINLKLVPFNDTSSPYPSSRDLADRINIALAKHYAAIISPSRMKSFWRVSFLVWRTSALLMWKPNLMTFLRSLRIMNVTWANATVHNVTNATPAIHDSFSDDPRVLVWIVIGLLTDGFGMVANTILLLAMIIHRPLRLSSSCALIAHCIVIDIYATAVAIPTDTIPVYLGPDWPLPKTFCNYQVKIRMASRLREMSEICFLLTLANCTETFFY